MNPDLFDHGAQIRYREDCRFGDYVVLDIGVVSSVTMDIGDYVHIAPYAVIIGGRAATLTMGHFSGISAGGKVICGGDSFASGALMNPQVPAKYREPIIEPVTFGAFSRRMHEDRSRISSRLLTISQNKLERSPPCSPRLRPAILKS